MIRNNTSGARNPRVPARFARITLRGSFRIYPGTRPGPPIDNDVAFDVAVDIAFDADIDVGFVFVVAEDVQGAVVGTKLVRDGTVVEPARFSLLVNWTKTEWELITAADPDLLAELFELLLLLSCANILYLEVCACFCTVSSNILESSSVYVQIINRKPFKSLISYCTSANPKSIR